MSVVDDNQEYHGCCVSDCVLLCELCEALTSIVDRNILDGPGSRQMMLDPKISDIE
jgi:hypothetical protein